MKKVIAKQGLRFLTAAFVLFGVLFLTATRSEAQTFSDDFAGQSQSVNWKTGSEALTALETALETLSNDLGVLTPGTPAYNNTMAHTHYYKEIYSRIEGGNAVGTAVVGSLEIFNLAGSALATNVDLGVTVDQGMRLTLYNDARTLLSN